MHDKRNELNTISSVKKELQWTERRCLLDQLFSEWSELGDHSRYWPSGHIFQDDVQIAVGFRRTHVPKRKQPKTGTFSNR